MTDGQAALVALMALCGAGLALIWQVSRLADRVNELQDVSCAMWMWLIRRDARRMREDGDGDGED